MSASEFLEVAALLFGGFLALGLFLYMVFKMISNSFDSMFRLWMLAWRAVKDVFRS
ncbi:hypothetical protein [Halobacillus naozhouensis]|uniref:Uncharacterized protein n=1 Tax=Halobacillus naozhouensis TaxID=554880 RepID=A0ABY8J6Q8_9BACI|nr:hypothetical protein [Halobacillus naozhouensis]WFT77109.1 hypothetical protein P9989_21495 [Halobacillus naozhouensis]